MKKTVLMLVGFGVVLAAGNACYFPGSKPDRNPPYRGATNAPPTAPVAR